MLENRTRTGSRNLTNVLNPPSSNQDACTMKVEQLYLLEVLIKTIELGDGSKVGLVSEKGKEPKLCVKVQFLDLPCIEICEGDSFGEDLVGGPASRPLKSVGAEKSGQALKSSPKGDDGKKTKSDKSLTRQKSDKNMKPATPKKSDKSVKSEKSKSSIKSEDSKKDGKGKQKAQKTNLDSAIDFNSGKSCLFPMAPLDLVAQLKRHPVGLYLLQKTQDEQGNLIGRCMLRLGTEFTDTILKATFDTDLLPVISTIESDSKLTNMFGDQQGTMKLFMRLSCFGSTIVTQFQLSGKSQQDYVFRTSKKDNTVEAQKKRGCFNYETPKYIVDEVKTTDASPLPPIITTEDGFAPVQNSEEQPPQFEFPDKLINWKKYTKECKCEEVLQQWNQSQLNSGGTSSESEIYNQLSCFPPNNSEKRKSSDSDYKKGMFDKSNNKTQRMSQGGTLRNCSCTAAGNQNQQTDARNPEDSSSNTNGHRSSIVTKTYNGSLTSFCKCSNGNVNNNNNNNNNNNIINSNNNNNGRMSMNFNNYGVARESPQQTLLRYRNSKLNESKRLSQSTQCNDQSKNTKHNICNCFFADLHVNVNTNVNNNKFQRATSVSGCNKSIGDACCCNEGGSTGNCNVNNYTKCGGDGDISYNKINASNGKDCSDSVMDERFSTKSCCEQQKKRKSVVKGSSLEIKSPEKSLMDDTKANESHAEFGYQSPRDDKGGGVSKLELRAGGGDGVASGKTHNEDLSNVEKKTTEKKKDSITEKKGEKVNPIGPVPREPPEELQKLKPEKSTHQKEHKLKEKTQVSNQLNVNEKSATEIAMEEQLARKKRRKYYRSIYYYSAGMYPGVNVGHRHCTREPRLVPKTMGWLWNIGDQHDGLRPRRGWKPGAINTRIAKMIKQGKTSGTTASPSKEEMLQPKAKAKRVRKPGTQQSGNTTSTVGSSEFNTGQPSPTLHLHKKSGAYFIAVKPLKAESDDDEELSAPIMFKILPHDDEVSTSSESSLEIEFTAPGAFRKKVIPPVKENIETQYSDVAIEMPPAKEKPKKSKKGGGQQETKPEGKDKKEKVSDKLPDQKSQATGQKENTPPTAGSEPKEKKQADPQTQVAKTKK